MEVINALMRNTIDVKRASLIIRALHIAVKNAARVKFGIQEPVTQVPEYAPPTEQHEAIAQQSELPAVSAIPYKPVEPTHPHFWEYSEEGARILAREAQARKAAIGKERVGTGAFARPGREATVPAATIAPHDFKTPQPAPQHNASPQSQSATQQSPTQHKPPGTAKPAPKERTNAAHAASRG